MLPKISSFRYDSGQVSFREAGEGPALLFLHGLNGNSKSWRRQFEGLADQFRLIAWDAPGYGDSSPAEPDIDVYSDIAADLMEGLGIATYAVVGHSMGGVIAGRLAARHPRRINRLVLSCSQPGMGLAASESLGQSYVDRIENRKNLSDNEFGKFGAGRMLPGFIAPDIFNEVAEIASEVRPQGLEAAIRVINYADNRSLLAGLDCPVLIIDAELDPVISPERTSALEAIMPQVERATIRGAGHAPYLENGEAYNQIICEFMNS